MTEIQFQATGNLTNDPELRFTPAGNAVANFTLAVTPRVKNAAGGYVDGETTFLRCSVWSNLAENVAASLSRGHRVSVTGILRSRTYTTKDDETRTVIEANVNTVGVDLQFTTVQVAPKVSRQAPEADPWAAPPPRSVDSLAGPIDPDDYQRQMQGLRPPAESDRDAAVQDITSRLGGQVVQDSPF